VNGVAAIHTDLVKRDLFPEFVEYYKSSGQAEKFVNMTNGVTQRRWVYCANRPLAKLFTSWLGSDSWIKKFDMISGIGYHIDDKEKQEQWRLAKRSNKVVLANWVKRQCGVELNVDTMLFDIQVKRIHEYKRQFLNCLYCIHRYLHLKQMSPAERMHCQPRACLIGGKAAPGYHVAKSIIKLCNSVADVVNNDPDVADYFKMVFLPNYNVSNAQIIIPASDISQHISTAGTEASGTSNMKFVMNGGLIIGTFDGANVEICEECGADSMFIFGAHEDRVEKIREEIRNGYNPIDGRLMEIFEYIRGGSLCRNDAEAQENFNELIDRLILCGNGHCGDYYLLIHDFPDYCRAQDLVDMEYRNKTQWVRRSMKAASCMGKFSSDRTIHEYANFIWKLETAVRPDPRLQPMRGNGDLLDKLKYEEGKNDGANLLIHSSSNARGNMRHSKNYHKV
ncbi:putative glycogen phosphorylase 1, partial [Cardiosporidium cionae]